MHFCASINFSSNQLRPYPLAKHRPESCGYLIKIKLKGQFDSCTIHISRAQKPQLTSGYCTGQHWSTAIHWFIKYSSTNSMRGPGKAV